MKKKRLLIISLVFILTVAFSGCTKDTWNVNGENSVQEQFINKDTIEYTGWLKTNGAELQNQHGESITLRGVSSHGIQWFPDVITYDNLKQLKDNWKINVFRIAMYTDPNADGYIAHPEKTREDVYRIIEDAKKLDMYVIVDWHILNDRNPQMYQAQAKEFFEQLAEKYSDVPNVLYEICNEPNGNEVKWNENVKPYAEDIINTIRAKSKKALIIVGTPDWCKDLKTVAENPLNYENIVYSCHFYAGTHGEELQKKIDYCIEKNIPIFVSECGLTDATGAGEIYKEKFEKWIEFLSERNISWVYWSFCNKQEGSSILSTTYPANKNTTPEDATVENAENTIENMEINIDDYLTEAGQYIKETLRK